MKKQKNSSNFFDELDEWPDAPKMQKKNVFQEPADDWDSFTDAYGITDVQTRRTSSGMQRSGRPKRGKAVTKLLAGIAVVICAVAIVLAVGGETAETPAPTQAVVPQPSPPIDTTPAIPSPQPAPVPQQEYRYFGRKLNAEQRQVYTAIQEGISRHDESIGPFHVTNLDDIQLIVQSVIHDYPEYFWFNGVYEYLYYDRGTYMECTLNNEYTFSDREYAGYAAYVEAAAQPILSKLEGKSDYEKVKGVYEYLIDNTAYDLNYMGTTIYEVFHDRRAVCEGYARATQYLLTKLGVETLYCTGMSGGVDEPRNQWESHAWNIVKIDGIYYGLDTTWGDPLNDGGIQTKNFWYLNLTDAEMERRHDREDWSSYPACTDTRHNFYIYEGYYLEFFDKEIIKTWFQEAYARGEQLEFKCASESIYQQAYNWLVYNGGFDEVFRTVIPQDQGYQYSYTYSDDIYVFRFGKN